MHPLQGSLSELTNEELHHKHTEIMEKLNFAYRTGNFALLSQLQMINEHYLEEIQRRNTKALEDMQKRSQPLKKIINVK